MMNEPTILFNGEPLVFEDEPEECYCRRCYLHDDPANCLYQQEEEQP